MPDEPAYRISSARTMLAQLDRLFPETGERVRAALPEETLALVRESLSLTWIPAETHHQIADAVYSALGERDYRALWRKVFLDMVQTPLLKPFFEATIRLFGATPAGLARWTAKGYTLATRGLGTLQLAADDPVARRVEIEHIGYPPALAVSGAHVAGTAGSFEGYLDVTRKTGSVTVLENTPARGYARFEIAWNE
jgi:hypothetical protein